MMHDSIGKALLADAEALAAVDSRLGRAATLDWTFPIRQRPQGFATLVYIILEQQVSLAAARAMYAKLTATIDPLTPDAFLTLDDDTLKTCGFSRQKMRYARLLAEAIGSGDVDLDAIAAMGDDDAIAALCRIVGIGEWSAECYLLWALGRRDVMPAKDLALQIGWQWLLEASGRPTAEELRAAAEPWRPRRTAAALLIWNYYLSRLEERRRNDR